MIHPGSSLYGNRGFLCHYQPGFRFIRYSIIFLLSLWIFSLGFVPCATAAENVSDMNSQMDVPENNESGDATILTDTAAPDNEGEVNALIEKGFLCYNSADYACAWTSFESAHALLPGDTDILYYHGYLLSLQKHYREALEKIDTGLALDPENPDLLYEKGTILNSMGRYIESGPYFDRAEEIDPDYAVPLSARFPLNLFVKNGAVIVVVIGFSLLGIYIYVKERRR